jgi:hypothetical protein
VKILVVLLVLAVVGVGAVVLLSGGDDDSSDAAGGNDSGGESGDAGGAGDPAQAVEDFLAATGAGDCPAAMELVTESSLSLYGGSYADAVTACQAAVDSGEGLAGADMSVEGTEVTSNDGTTAVVALSATADGETETTDVTVRNEGGSWKVDVTAMGGSASGGGAVGGGSPGG